MYMVYSGANGDEGYTVLEEWTSELHKLQAKLAEKEEKWLQLVG